MGRGNSSLSRNQIPAFFPFFHEMDGVIVKQAAQTKKRRSSE